MDNETRIIKREVSNNRQINQRRAYNEDSNPVAIKQEFKKLLSSTQNQILEAVDKGDKDLFLKAGGSSNIDLNFEITSEGVFPLLLASAKGK